MVIYTNHREVIVLKSDTFKDLYPSRNFEDYERFEAETDCSVSFLPSVDIVNQPFN